MTRSNCNEELRLQDANIILMGAQADIENNQNTSAYTLQHSLESESERCLRRIDSACIKADDQTLFLFNNGRDRNRHRVIMAIAMLVSAAVLPALYFFHGPSVSYALPTGAISVLSPALTATVPVPVDAGKEHTQLPHFPDNYSGHVAEAKINSDSVEPPEQTAEVMGEAVPLVTEIPVENDSEPHEPGTDNTIVQPEVFVTRFPPVLPVQPGKQNAAVITVHRNNTADRLSVMTDAAYAAYVAGRFQDARQGYLSILKENYNHRDALLGMAAVSQRIGDSNQAWRIYQRILSGYPYDPVTTAGLINLTKGRDQDTDIITIGKLLHKQPHAAYLHFTLGSLHAGAGRWPEARAAFAEASRLEGNNPDYACNLAVTLDRLGDVEGARSYYGKALELSRYRKPYFDLDEVRSRLASLTDTVSERHAP